jgi:hypothetical protein
MEPYLVTVIDGPLAPNIWEHPGMQPDFVTDPKHLAVREELIRREPVFHRREFGITRADFDRLMAPGFWEVGASGRRYSREFILDTLDSRYAQPTEAVWEISDFQCREIGPESFLVTYTLNQTGRITRRSTIWRRNAGDWQICFHQGTLVT